MSGQLQAATSRIIPGEL